MSLSCTLLNVDAGAIGRILLWGFKFGTVEPRGRVVPTCTANGRAGEVQEGVAPRNGTTLGTVGTMSPTGVKVVPMWGTRIFVVVPHNIFRVQLRRRRRYAAYAPNKNVKLYSPKQADKI